MTGSPPRTAVLIPCLNEEGTVGKVVDDFRAALPGAEIYVFDNRSDDRTAAVAREHGASVVHVAKRGKGAVVSEMLRTVDADVYVMADGDDTYPADAAPRLVAPVADGRADMVVGTRLEIHGAGSFRPMHVFGNKLVRALVNRIFRARLTDIMSGYRAFNRKAARSLPLVSGGFEVETELTINALYHRLEIVETPIAYRERPAGSASKLRTVSDGARVVWRLFSLFRAYKPLTFFGGLGLALLLLALWAGWGPVEDYMREQYVHRVPRAILATGLVLLSAGSALCGVLLHAINWRFKELHSLSTRR